MLKNMENFMELDLQLFASEPKEPTEPKEPAEPTEPTEPQDKPLTAEEIQKMIQSESDKIRTEYSKKLKDKEKELNDIKKEKMSEEELKALEIEQIRQENEALRIEKLGYIIQTELAKQSLPLEASEIITADNEEDIVKKVSTLKLIIDNAVTAKASELYRNKGTEHKQGSEKVGTMTKEEFNALGIKERTELFNTNPELYKELTK